MRADPPFGAALAAKAMKMLAVQIW